MKIAFVVSEDFNLGVGYVISYLKKRGDEVRLFFDPRQFSRAYAQNSRLARFFNKEDYNVELIRQFNPDICGFSCITANFRWAIKMAHKVKKIGCRVVFGGVHPTLCPEDFPYEVCQGDGAKFFGGTFDPTVWPEREMFLKHLPPIHRKVQMFLTSFGCPFRCSFCNNHQLHKKLIRRDPIDCINEINSVKGLEYVLFEDDIFTIDKSWLKTFLPRLKFPFTCFGHPKFLDEEVVSLLSQNGCQMIWLGLQTASEVLRKNILNRFETNQEIKNACKLIKKWGIKIMIDHIFGIPTETEEDILYSYDFYKGLKPDVVNCYELLYFPKAEINKFGKSKAKYQNQGGRLFKKYAKSFWALPLVAN